MKRWAFALVVVAAAGAAACQRQAVPERTAESDPAGEATPPAEVASRGADDGAPAPPEARPENAAPPARTAPRPAPAPPEARSPARPADPAPEAPPVAAGAPSVPRGVTPPSPLVLAAGTSLPIVMQTTAASNTSQAGDRVIAEIAEDVAAGGRVVLPEGTEVIGRVVAAQGSGRVKGRARLAVEFEEVRVGGASYVLEATPLDVTAESSKGRDAKILGGAAAAGAIIGGIADGGKGALKGGAIGGAAGGAAVLATKGSEVVFKAGERYAIELRSRLQVD